MDNIQHLLNFNKYSWNKRKKNITADFTFRGLLTLHFAGFWLYISRAFGFTFRGIHGIVILSGVYNE